MAHTLAKEERETIIVMSDADDTWTITTAQRRVISKCLKSKYPVADDIKVSEPYQAFRCPRRCISFRGMIAKKAIKVRNMEVLRSFRGTRQKPVSNSGDES